tara:strand:+ start:65 stop:319 length:255 start_codon:yes stop_codon:yes gene_type:complete
MEDNIALEKAIELADEIGDVYQGSDWLVVKKYILKYLNPTYRRRFSTRDEKTKKHTINDFENSLIDYYQQQFNVRLKLDEEKKL